MKKYKLLQWYPSLPPGLKTGMIVEFDGINSIRWEIRDEYEFTDYNYKFNGLELKCEQFWELIKEEKENEGVKKLEIMKTAGQVMDEINQMNDGSIMEIYKVQGGFKTKFQSGWTPAPTDDLCHKCGGVMKFTGISKLSLPAQNEYRCEKCKHVQYRIEKII